VLILLFALFILVFGDKTIFSQTYGRATVSGGKQEVSLESGQSEATAESTPMVVTGHSLGNTLAKINRAGNFPGQVLTIIFRDALVTLTDDNSHAAGTLDLSLIFVSSTDATITMIYDGVSWYEIGRSNN
jgi:hypothetical protein